MNTYLKRLFIRPELNYKPIDGIRAIAVLWVIIFHAWLFQYNGFQNTADQIFQNPFLIWISKGDLGVDLFFVISGFLIGTILFKEYKKNKSLNFKRFYMRRFLRLMPVYVFSMIIGVYFLNGTPAGNWKMAWSNLLYINNFVRESYMGWTWSLAIEEQFYLVIPFLIAFIFPLFRNKFYPFIILLLTTIGLSYHYLFNIFNFQVPFKSQFLDEAWMDWFWGYYMLTHLRYSGLLIGVMGAYLNVFRKDELISFFNNKKNVANFFFLSSLTIFFLISSVSLGQWTNLESSIFENLSNNIAKYYEIIHREIFGFSIVFITLSCLYFKSIFVRPVNNFLSSKIFYPIAQVSYSAYLFHEMFMFWFFPKFISAYGNSLTELQIILFNSLISIFAIILGAVLMYLFIEQPFQDLKNKLSLERSSKRFKKEPSIA